MDSSSKLFMQRSFDLALKSGKAVKGNPKVGAVLVYNHKIIGEGYHQRYGGPHAEVAAIEDVPERLKHLIPLSTLYVSLEPCCHYGKTPPCCERIWSEGIRHVVVGIKDPNPLVSGKGIAFLKSKGVHVEMYGVEKEAAQIISRFKANLDNLPYIILKWAQSKDLYLSEKGKQTWLSHPLTSVLTHKWRASVDAIMTGSQTAMIDNPTLNVRAYFGENPIRIILSQDPDKLDDLSILTDSESTWIVNASRSKSTQNKSWIKVPDLYDLNHILKMLFDLGIHSLIVEGGGKVLQSFLSRGLWHEARVIRTTKEMETSGIPAPSVEGILIDKYNIVGDEILIIKNASV